MKNLREFFFGFSFVVFSFGCVIGQTTNNDESNTIKAEEDSTKTGFGISMGIGRRTREILPSSIPIITNVILDKTEVFSRELDNTSQIEVFTEAFDAENDVLIYEYTVSSGKIIGFGAKVIWDLSGEKAGTYTITVGADDGCSICGPKITREVRVIE